jgi:hypothetical protein
VSSLWSSWMPVLKDEGRKNSSTYEDHVKAKRRQNHDYIYAVFDSHTKSRGWHHNAFHILYRIRYILHDTAHMVYRSVNPMNILIWDYAPHGIVEAIFAMYPLLRYRMEHMSPMTLTWPHMLITRSWSQSWMKSIQWMVENGSRLKVENALSGSHNLSQI